MHHPPCMSKIVFLCTHTLTCGQTLPTDLPHAHATPTSHAAIHCTCKPAATHGCMFNGPVPPWPMLLLPIKAVADKEKATRPSTVPSAPVHSPISSFHWLPGLRHAQFQLCWDLEHKLHTGHFSEALLLL
jgi:hypothetical protein